MHDEENISHTERRWESNSVQRKTARDRHIFSHSRCLSIEVRIVATARPSRVPQSGHSFPRTPATCSCWFKRCQSSSSGGKLALAVVKTVNNRDWLAWRTRRPISIHVEATRKRRGAMSTAFRRDSKKKKKNKTKKKKRGKKRKWRLPTTARSLECD